MTQATHHIERPSHPSQFELLSRPLGMRLVQARIVTDDVERTAGFFASVLDREVPLNEYYVELPTAVATVGISRLHYTEWESTGPQMILDFEVEDLDEHYQRLDRLGVDWLLQPTVQPWGNRTMTFRSPDGVLVNVFARLRPAEQSE